ncbi:MAG: rhodanese-like domain-containing protein [Clostridia bacterium]|nr:rhodanese-like domain-containing protein [Clostridia bacterium]
MKRIFQIIMLCIVSLGCLSSCTNDKVENITETTKENMTMNDAVYENITAQEAKRIMDTQTGYVILDVRTPEEYDEKHIPEAILIPDYEIHEKAEGILPDKNQLILVYCRSGRRSKLASEDLLELGYKNIKEFGGIIDWPYETE